MVNRFERRLNKCLFDLQHNNILDQRTYESLRATGSDLGKLYGLPKVHKQEVPLRPILSAMNTHNYKLAKFLVPLLQPLCTSDLIVSNVFEFANFIRQQHYNSITRLASVDVESLFTNVPVHETINIILDRCFISPSATYKGFTHKSFQELLELAVNDSYLTFNDIIYRQKDGVAMGSTLGLVFANIFMSAYEKIRLEEARVKSLLYRRYVDDTFLIFKPTADIKDFVTFLNSQHPNLRFTNEEEIDGYLPFIGITIFHDINKPGFLSTKVYRKPTFTEL